MIFLFHFKKEEEDNKSLLSGKILVSNNVVPMALDSYS
jgi:hypothetical protein